MALRMRRSISIAKGVRLNFGKTGLSLSFGTRGLRHTIHSSGRRTSSVGLPGTGISYVTTSGGGRGGTSAGHAARRPLSPAQLQRQEERYNTIKENESLVRDYEDLLELLKNMHKDCDSAVDWHQINSIKEPFNPNGMGPRQEQATQALQNFKPNFFQSIIKSLGERKKAELTQAAEQAEAEDRAEYEAWKNLNRLSKRVLAGDIDAYFAVISEMNPFDDLLEYGSDFEFGADTSTAMEVEFRIKSAEIVPTFSLSLTKTGRVSKKELTKTAYFGLVQDYVCSCSIRIARDMFALLPINTISIHAVDNILSTATGHQDEVTILSVLIERDSLNKLNLSNIDPSNAMTNFRHHMKFLKTSGFQPVERISAT